MNPRRRIVAMVVMLGGMLDTSMPAVAQQRIEAAQQNCSALQSLVQRSGRVLLYTGPYLYDTYTVSCVGRQSEIPAYLRTRDNPQCFVGYSCGPSVN